MAFLCQQVVYLIRQPQHIQAVIQCLARLIDIPANPPRLDERFLLLSKFLCAGLDGLIQVQDLRGEAHRAFPYAQELID